MTDHVVYLANSSGVKVGITRATQVPTRWIDQGASQALPILRVATRQQSGLVEDLLRSQVADRTNWRALLKGDAEAVDLPAVREQLFDHCSEGLSALQQRFGLQAIQPLADAEVVQIRYPVDGLSRPKWPATTSRRRQWWRASLLRHQGPVPDPRHRRDQPAQIHGLPGRRFSPNKRPQAMRTEQPKDDLPQGLPGSRLPDRRDPPDLRAVRGPHPGARPAGDAAQPRAPAHGSAAAGAGRPAAGTAGAEAGRPRAVRRRLPAGATAT